MHDGGRLSAVPPAAAGVGAVVVFYHPDADCVARANRLAAALHCVVVDNTPGPTSAVALGLDPAIDYLPNAENVGIAIALNQGVEVLIAKGFAMALLFDQDSKPAPELLTGLPAAITAAEAAGRPVAVAGPAYEDIRLRGVAPFVRFGWGRFRRVAPTGDRPIDVDFLITSGSCINLRHWHAIGPMDAALFIDFVDLEWCVRAKRAGFRVIGVPWLRLSHQLGGEPVRVFGRNYPMHGPIRHYYQFRNVVALAARASMPLSWKSAELVKLPVRIVIYCLLPERRREHLRMACRGAIDGLLGRLGPYRPR
ncbi:glycosyltransferase family 2 protein [Burkholderia glumae]|uniref:Glycosyltransferase family 2 protein n=1 Tax=Burkholderia glumae TaxID=337 RepID=A0AAP9Y5R7_BURGL|nr:glycosyltransferase family 2 protein [Burkholderia glumae]ACR27922.1 Rhamnosyltransferase [Burkholderia glumae BGR1]AJY67908.1 glycosyl transferase 2 family protein [Burkholderia glumae LMG 2196 = ATCC 33617]KHJ62070.1 rhamnosyltransferase [Burkholderia glumae]MCM2537226.1 glycosyltransferase family 2 protein [Burkholderia glumae]PNL02388.1 glycosyltransferase family 2 protein [Burkholderia glumae]